MRYLGEKQRKLMLISGTWFYTKAKPKYFIILLNDPETNSVELHLVTDL